MLGKDCSMNLAIKWKSESQIDAAPFCSLEYKGVSHVQLSLNIFMRQL